MFNPIHLRSLSLQYNSLGFYQLMKVLTTPAIVAIQLWFFNVPLHPRLRLALLPICVGVALATVSDVEVNALGTVFALLGIASTSMYQLWVKTKQQDLGLDSYQLLFLQAPTSAVLVLAISFITEPWGFAFDASPVSAVTAGAGADPATAVSILSYPYTFESSCAILGTGVLSFCVNLSIFLVIGKTSPVAYNVLGHFKLVCILLSGLVLFGEDAGAAKLIGTALTLGGVLAYTHWQQNLKSGWEVRDKAAKEEPDVAVLVPTSPSAATGAALGPRGLEFASLSRPLVVDAEQTQTLSARFDGSDAVQRPATKL